MDWEEKRKRPTLNGDDDEEDASEDGKILSREESTMPARYCIHTIFIRAKRTSGRDGPNSREKEKKRGRERGCESERNGEIAGALKEMPRSRLRARSFRSCSNLLKQIGLFMGA